MFTIRCQDKFAVRRENVLLIVRSSNISVQRIALLVLFFWLRDDKIKLNGTQLTAQRSRSCQN